MLPVLDWIIFPPVISRKISALFMDFIIFFKNFPVFNSCLHKNTTSFVWATEMNFRSYFCKLVALPTLIMFVKWLQNLVQLQIILLRFLHLLIIFLLFSHQKRCFSVKTVFICGEKKSIGTSCYMVNMEEKTSLKDCSGNLAFLLL